MFSFFSGEKEEKNASEAVSKEVEKEVEVVKDEDSNES